MGIKRKQTFLLAKHTTCRFNFQSKFFWCMTSTTLVVLGFLGLIPCNIIQTNGHVVRLRYFENDESTHDNDALIYLQHPRNVGASSVVLGCDLTLACDNFCLSIEFITCWSSSTPLLRPPKAFLQPVVPNSWPCSKYLHLRSCFYFGKTSEDQGSWRSH